MGLNKFRLSEWLIELSDSSHPHELMVEVTMKCNYDCIHCFRRKLINEVFGEMDLRLYRELLRQAKDAKVNKIVFSGWGEPLVHPNILDMMSDAKKYGFKVLLNTNGSLLRDYAEDIVRLGIDEVVVSVDSVEPDLYKALRIGGSLSIVTEGLLILRDKILRSKSWKPVVSIQFTVNMYNFKDVEKLVDYSKKVGVTNVIISNLIPLSIDYEESLACYQNPKCLSEIERAKQKLVRESLNSNVYVSIPSFKLVSERRCPFISRYASFIRWDGGVSPCIFYAHSWKAAFMGVERTINAVIFGNISDKHLIEIWRDKRYAEFRFRTYFFFMPSCLDCPLVKYCDYTLSNNADCWGNEPSCAHCPYSHDMVRCPL